MVNESVCNHDCDAKSMGLREAILTGTPDPLVSLRVEGEGMQ